jgi:RNA polymerase sigma-70 factor (ECF subfamily)
MRQSCNHTNLDQRGFRHLMDSNPRPGEVTRHLAEVKQGNSDAADKLVSLVYPELRKIARRYLGNERPDHTLEATALVHEAYLRLVEETGRNWQSRTHFFAIAAHTMRQILVDHARAHQAKKRGGKERKLSLDSLAEMPLEFIAVMREQDYPRLLMLDEALSKLQKQDPQQVKVVELRFFAGLTEEEVAEVVGISVQIVKREWKAARTWLYREMTK